jgi:hypothetical protein
MDKHQEAGILDGAVRTLADLGVRATVLAREARVDRTHPVDGTLRLGYGGTDEVRPIEIKRYITPAALGAIQAQLTHRGERTLLVTDYVTPPVADRLRRLEIQFVDTAGNAYIKTPNTLIWVRGQQPRTTVPAGQPTGRAFEPTGLRVLFALLCEPQRIRRTYRDLAQDTGVAHGTVGWVMADLQARGFIAQLRKPNGTRALVRLELLLPQWAEAYARALRPKLLMARYRQGDAKTLLAPPRATPGMLVGGEIAAARLTHNLKPATATFWAPKVDPAFIVTNRLTLDPAGNIEVLRKFWTFPTIPKDAVPDVLIYADLLAIGDARTLEIARDIQGRILDRLIKQT